MRSWQAELLRKPPRFRDDTLSPTTVRSRVAGTWSGTLAPVNGLDRFIRDRRIVQAARWIRPGSRVLDIGCHDGALFRHLGPALREGVGIDPDLAGPLEGSNYSLRPGVFPVKPTEGGAFDAVCALAVFEHVPPDQRARFAAGAARAVRPGGEVVLTVPSPRVD